MNKEDKDLINLGDITDLKGRYISFDTETTGLNYAKDHIISIAGVEILDGRLTGRQFEGFIKPRVYITREAINIHKLENTFYTDFYANTYHSDEDIFRNFAEFVRDSPLIAYNASFDYNFLVKEFKTYNIPVIPKEKFICSMKLFRRIFSEIDPSLRRGYTLKKCCEYLGIKSHNDQSFHSALYDSYMCAKLTCKIIDFKKANQFHNKKGLTKLQEMRRNAEMKKGKIVYSLTLTSKPQLNEGLRIINDDELNNMMEEAEYKISNYYEQEQMLGRKQNSNFESTNKYWDNNVDALNKDTDENSNSVASKKRDRTSHNLDLIAIEQNNNLDTDHIQSLMDDLVQYINSNKNGNKQLL